MRLAIVLILAACAAAPAVVIKRADERAQKDDLKGALVLYDQVARRKDTAPHDRAQALLDGAQLADRLHDPEGARTRLERASQIDTPGLTEEALFYLAEHLRGSDHARALNLYYRAAAIAQRNGGGFPYKIAMDRIMLLSVGSP